MPVPARDVLSAPGDGNGICSRCGGVIIKFIYTVSKVFPFTRFLKTLCEHSDTCCLSVPKSISVFYGQFFSTFLCIYCCQATVVSSKRTNRTRESKGQAA